MKKRIIKICAFSGLLLAIAGLVTFSMISHNGNEQTHETVVSEEQAPIKLKKLANPNTTDSYIVKAEITPEWMANVAITWATSWSRSSVNNINDYVTITPSTDTLSVTVKFIKSFDTQIILTASCNLEGVEPVTCTIDCYKRTENVTVSGQGYCDEEYVDLEIDNEKRTITYNGFGFYEMFGGGISGFGNLGAVNTIVGTVALQNYVNYSISLHDDLIEKLSESGINRKEDNVSYTNNGENFQDVLHELIDWDSSTEHEIYTILASTSNWFTLHVQVTGMYNGQMIDNVTFDYTLTGFDLRDYTADYSMSLDKESILF